MVFQIAVSDNPVISMMAMMEEGFTFEPVEITEREHDREGEKGDKSPDAE